MNNSLKDWNALLLAMVNSNYYGGRVVVNPFKLEVVSEGQKQGFLVKTEEGILLTKIFEIPLRSGATFQNSFIHEGVTKGWSREEMSKIFYELQYEFFLAVIKGQKSENLKFFCPDIPTLHKWTKVLKLKFKN